MPASVKSPQGRASIASVANKSGTHVMSSLGHADDAYSSSDDEEEDDEDDLEEDYDEEDMDDMIEESDEDEEEQHKETVVSRPGERRLEWDHDM